MVFRENINCKFRISSNLLKLASSLTFYPENSIILYDFIFSISENIIELLRMFLLFLFII